MEKAFSYFKRLEIQVVAALVLAIFCGIYFPEYLKYVDWMWDLFMKLLKVMLWPLLFFSVMVAILWLWDFKKLWSIWSRTFGYYMLTTTVAISFSLLLMNLFKPWEWLKFWFEQWFNSAQVEWLSFWSFIWGLIPSNIVNAFVEFNAMQIVTMWIILWIAILATKKQNSNRYRVKGV